MDIQRVLAGHQVGLAAVAAFSSPFSLGALAEVHPKAGELERIAPDHQVAHRLQRGQWAVAAVGLADAGKAVSRLQLDDGADRIGRVATVGAPQRSVSNGNGVEMKLGNDHGR